MLMFMYTIVSRGVGMAARLKINDERTTRDYGAKVDSEYYRKTKKQYKDMNYTVEMKWKKGNQMQNDKKTQEISGRVIASFGL